MKPIELELEIGMGRAHFLFDRARVVPERQIIGIEYKARWVTQAFKRQQREQVYNVIPIQGHAWEIVPQLLAPESVSLIILNFPDPWWKRRHRKRRILNEKFLDILLEVLKTNGCFFFQTDVFELFEVYQNLLTTKLSVLSEGENPLGAQSHREKKCEFFGKPIYRLMLQKL